MVYLYRYPFALNFEYDGVLNTGFEHTEGGGVYGVVVFVNAIASRDGRRYHRVERVPMGVVDNMDVVDRKITRDEAKGILKGVALNRLRLYLHMYLEMAVKRLEEEEDEVRRAAETLRKNVMARKIQSLWLRRYYDPTDPICIRRNIRQMADIV